MTDEDRQRLAFLTAERDHAREVTDTLRRWNYDTAEGSALETALFDALADGEMFRDSLGIVRDAYVKDAQP